MDGQYKEIKTAKVRLDFQDGKILEMIKMQEIHPADQSQGLYSMLIQCLVAFWRRCMSTSSVGLCGGVGTMRTYSVGYGEESAQEDKPA